MSESNGKNLESENEEKVTPPQGGRKASLPYFSKNCATSSCHLPLVDSNPAAAKNHGLGQAGTISPEKTGKRRFRLIETAARAEFHLLRQSIAPFATVAAAPATMTHQVLLFSRQGCHLCDEAEEVLLRHGLAPHKIDIDASTELRERYDTCVPVVVIDGKERFRGRINEVLLHRLLRHG